MSLENAVINTVSSLQTFETKQKIAHQLAAKQLDIVKDQGQMVLELIEGASPQGKAPGAGAKFDAHG